MADSAGIASAEIAETLRAERDRFELSVATFRIRAFALTATAGTVAGIVQTGYPGFAARWGAPIYLALCFLVSLAIREWVRREGASNRVIYAVICAEVVGIGLISIVISHASPPHEAFDPIGGTNWARHTVGASLMLMLALCSMRWHHRASVLGMALAVAMYGVNIAYFGFEPPHFMGLALLVVIGLLGVRGAGQQRSMLERFARSQLMRRFLPTAGVSAVEEGNDPYALGTRAVTVTMMMTDLRGFTAMSERLEPAAMVAQLNEYHGAMYDVIETHGGMLEKFIGDGALAVFGWPTSPDEGASAAVACGRAMLERLVALNAERATRGEPALAMGIGVHTGQVIAGTIGAPGRRVEFTFLGDAVNMASRIEALTKSMGRPLLVSAETVARLPSGSGLGELGAVEIRGKTDPVKLWS